MDKLVMANVGTSPRGSGPAHVALYLSNNCIFSAYQQQLSRIAGLVEIFNSNSPHSQTAMVKNRIIIIGWIRAEINNIVDGQRALAAVVLS